MSVRRSRTHKVRKRNRKSPIPRSVIQYAGQQGSANTRLNITSPPDAVKLIPSRFPNKRISILDYGAGNGRSSVYLRDEGYMNVVPYDPHKKAGLIDVYDDFDRNETYDLVIVSFVMNTLPKQERNKMIADLNKIKAKHILVINRTVKDVESAKTKRKYQDGYIMDGRKSFQKGYTDKMMTNIGWKLGANVIENFHNSNSSIAYLYTL